MAISALASGFTSRRGMARNSTSSSSSYSVTASAPASQEALPQPFAMAEIMRRRSSARPSFASLVAGLGMGSDNAADDRKDAGSAHDAIAKCIDASANCRWQSAACVMQMAIAAGRWISGRCSPVRRLVEALGRGREDLDAVRRHADGVLELRGQRAVARHRGPAVGQHLHVRPAEIDHRLDREEHAGARARCLRPAGRRGRCSARRGTACRGRGRRSRAPRSCAAPRRRSGSRVPMSPVVAPGRITAMPRIMAS